MIKKLKHEDVKNKYINTVHESKKKEKMENLDPDIELKWRSIYHSDRQDIKQVRVEKEIPTCNVRTTSNRTKIDGDRVQYGDQVIDFGEKPPVKYIQSENGDWNFKSTELNFKRDTELSHEKEVLTTELDNIDTKLA